MGNPKNQIAEIRVTYKPKLQVLSEISSSYEAYKVLFSFFSSPTINLQEQFLVMYLNKSNKILGVYPVSVGGISGTVADPKLILGVALKTASSSIILAHNHPSGSLKPSQADIELTKKIVEAGKLLDIKVLDHLIIVPSDDLYFSFADSGIL